MKIERRRWAAALVMACVVVLGVVMCVPAVAGTVGEKGAVDVGGNAVGAVDVPVSTVAAVRVHRMVWHGHRYYAHGRRHRHGKHGRPWHRVVTRQVVDPVSDEEVIERAVEATWRGNAGGTGDVGSGYTSHCMHQWFNDDLIGNLFSQIGQLIGKWISELLDGWIADGVQGLAWWLVRIVIKPLAALYSSVNNGAFWIVLAVGAALSTASSLSRRMCGWDPRMLLVWAAAPLSLATQYVSAYILPVNQLTNLDLAFASAIRGGMLAGVGGLASALVSLFGAAGDRTVSGLVGESVAFCGLVVFSLIGASLILLLVATIAGRVAHLLLLILDLGGCRKTWSSLEASQRCGVDLVLTVGRELQWMLVFRLLIEVMFGDSNPWWKCIVGAIVLWHGIKLTESQIRLDLERCGFKTARGI